MHYYYCCPNKVHYSLYVLVGSVEFCLLQKQTVLRNCRGFLATAWRRENLRVRLSSVPSIEETGLDAVLYGERQPFFTPRESLPAYNSVGGPASVSAGRNGTSRDDESFHDALAAVQATGEEKGSTKRVKQDGNGDEGKGLERGNSTPLQRRAGTGVEGTGVSKVENGRLRTQGSGVEIGGRMDSIGKKPSVESFAEVWQRLSASKGITPGASGTNSSLASEVAEKGVPNLGTRIGNYRSTSIQRTSSSHLKRDRLSGIDEGDLAEVESTASTPRKGDDHQDPFAGFTTQGADGSGTLPSPEGSTRLLRSSSGARNRWRRLKHTVHFAAQMTQLRQGAADLLEENANEQLHRQNSVKDDAGSTGAAAFEGAKTAATERARGRKGMEGMLVRHDKGFLTMMQDFYVACLKMPMGRFLLGVFLAPVALGMLFTPLFVLDMGGLSFDGRALNDFSSGEGPVAATKSRCTALLNVFLYALSLSTTFGGSPVVALSPFCLLVANVNTLMAQFLFVFLSGGVFARMSQPSHPVRCSKKAIIRVDDYVATPGEEKFRAFAVRLVLTGPAPCELVDAKICLTFRIFVKLPSGAMFCSTQDLELVRPEVSYLRYGLMVRHIVDRKSPLFGHTMETLTEGDASFSLTIMGLERTSMQSIFHLEDYFVCDGDVVWDGDYEDFIHINRQGQRVLDHSKIDSLKAFKITGIVTQAVSRMEADVARRKDKEAKEKLKETEGKEAEGKSVESPGAFQPPKGWIDGIRTRRLWKSKSTSFTRAPDW